ncbi:MAG: adenylate/guanylate cyclase domain-containing protein [Cyanobacteria bacterium P01_D01_bin.1]
MNTPAHPQAQRSLAAIVITDAVGFSKRMSQDEDEALAIINRDLHLIKKLCDSFEGRILKTTGDGVLMYFISAVKAASCAIEIQRQFAAFGQNGQSNRHFTHRVGVHLGDIFFNQDDMMGTGVNIAARLESEAKPGAVCMSQVVYEVVKYRLKLDVIYAGELSLKNIEECVAAYHVWPPDVQPQKSAAQFGEAVFPLATPLNTTLKTLSAHPQSHRIKKLLYATCHARWENDTKILEGVSLKLLLESLISRNANLSECQTSLDTTVISLNRSERYVPIAEIIVENLSDFYAESSSASISVSRPSLLDSTLRHQHLDMTALYRDVSSRLETSKESTRIKQLIYYVCCHQWETQCDRIQAVPMVALVQELRQRAASFQLLQDQLNEAVSLMSAETSYLPIADEILRESSILYPEKKETSSVSAYVHRQAVEDLPTETSGRSKALTFH